jgi:hypothetical protein
VSKKGDWIEQDGIKIKYEGHRDLHESCKIKIAAKDAEIESLQTESRRLVAALKYSCEKEDEDERDRLRAELSVLKQDHDELIKLSLQIMVGGATLRENMGNRARETLELPHAKAAHQRMRALERLYIDAQAWAEEDGFECGYLIYDNVKILRALDSAGEKP